MKNKLTFYTILFALFFLFSLNSKAQSRRINEIPNQHECLEGCTCGNYVPKPGSVGPSYNSKKLPLHYHMALLNPRPEFDLICQQTMNKEAELGIFIYCYTCDYCSGRLSFDPNSYQHPDFPTSKKDKDYIFHPQYSK